MVELSYGDAALLRGSKSGLSNDIRECWDWVDQDEECELLADVDWRPVSMREYFACLCLRAAFAPRHTDEDSLSRSVEVSLELMLDPEATSEIGCSSPRLIWLFSASELSDCVPDSNRWLRLHSCGTAEASQFWLAASLAFHLQASSYGIRIILESLKIPRNLSDLRFQVD